MSSSLAEFWEFLQIAAEALARYKLRTSLSVLGVVLGVAAVIAMMSVSEGARREALNQVQALGLDNLVARNQAPAGAAGTAQPHHRRRGSAAVADAAGAHDLAAHRAIPARRAGGNDDDGAGARRSRRVSSHSPIAGRARPVPVDAGREKSAAVCVLGGSLARQLFGFRDPIGERVRVGTRCFEVVGVLREQGADPLAPDARLARHQSGRDGPTAGIVGTHARRGARSTG
jgi:hypothetical protein